ncbi:MAG TPA: phosphate signaling complex protein PhoU [Chloroflexota bacterium]
MTRERYDEMLRELDSRVLLMGDLVVRSVDQSICALEVRDVAEARRLIEADNEIDNNRHDIENQALLLIATQQPLAKDLRMIASILTIATELERIGDYCEGIAKLTLRMASDEVVGSLSEIQTMATVTTRLLKQVLEAYRDRNLKVAGEVWKQDDAIDEMYERIFRNLIGAMAADPKTVRENTYLLWIAHNVERMADRVTNIAERVAFVVTGDVATFRQELEAQTLPT